MKRLVALLFAALAAPAGAQQPVMPIPGPLDGPLVRYLGAPTAARSLPVRVAPHNPALGAAGTSGSGLAAGNGGASPFPGPLGHGTTSASSLQFGTCSSLAFDRAGRLLAVCNGPLGPTLRLIDPGSLATIATLSLPARGNADRTDVAGATHFLVRADGSLLVPTHDGRLLTVAVDAAGLRETGRMGLAGLLRSGEKPYAVAAGFDGHDWVAGTQGTVLALPRGGGPPQRLELGEPVTEDLATDPSGTYVVTHTALYRLRLRRDGTPRVVWRHALPPGGQLHRASGRLHPGPGTPPVLVDGGYVAVADALDPPRVTVVRIASAASRRLACAVPVFGAGESSVESHLVVAGRSVVVSNTFGYANLSSTEGGRASTGGMARVVVGRRGCRVAWTRREFAPTAHAVVSRPAGLLYTLVKPPGFPDAWYLAAIDWRTGDRRFASLAGEGLGYNSEYSAVVLGRDGAAYAGTFGGVVRFADGS